MSQRSRRAVGGLSSQGTCDATATIHGGNCLDCLADVDCATKRGLLTKSGLRIPGTWILLPFGWFFDERKFYLTAALPPMKACRRA